VPGSALGATGYGSCLNSWLDAWGGWDMLPFSLSITMIEKPYHPIYNLGGGCHYQASSSGKASMAMRWPFSGKS